MIKKQQRQISTKTLFGRICDKKLQDGNFKYSGDGFVVQLLIELTTLFMHRVLALDQLNYIAIFFLIIR